MSTVMSTTRFAQEFRSICGAEHVIEDPQKLEPQNILGVAPALAVTPGSADEIVGILRVANEHGLTVVPAGGSTQQQSGNPPARVDVLLNTTRLTEVEHYDHADLTIGIGAGCTISQLSSRVAADNLLFAGDPALQQQCTVGGLLATGLYGPHRHGYGGLRDYCIGVRFVAGDGRKAKGGGRVVKNVAGYDMMKLLIGSWGTLGVITGASFKLFPMPRQPRTFVAEFASAREAIEFRNRILRSPLDPICMELVSPDARGFIPGFEPGPQWSICLRAAGSDAVLSRYRTEVGSSLSHEVEGRDEQAIWRAFSDFSLLVLAHQPRSLAIWITLPPAAAGPVLDRLTHAGQSHNLKIATVGRVGVGHLLAAFWPEKQEPQVAAKILSGAVAELQRRMPNDVSMSVLRCPAEALGQLAIWHPEPAALNNMRKVKTAMDPKNILNRGRFFV